MVAYTDAARIAAALGTTLTSDQQTQAGIVAQAASDWIDQYKGRSWQGSSPAIDVLPVLVDRVYLSSRPVVAITSVELRYDSVGSSYTTLAATQYELRDARAGLLRLIACSGYLVRVSYTHSGTVPPANVQLAATIIAGSLLAPTLAPQTAGIDSISVGQNDVAIKYSVDYGDVPPEALTLLGAKATVFA